MFPISQEDRLNLPKSSKVSDEQFNNRVREIWCGVDQDGGALDAS